MPIYQASSRVNRSDTDTLVIHCNDHRFHAGVQEFLNQGLKLNENYDLLVIPGGPQCLTLVEYLPKFSWASWKWFRFLVEFNELRRMILIAHQDCGWYKKLPFHLHAFAEPRARQEEDLRRLRQAIGKDFPEMNVEAYYAGWDSSDRVTVEAIAV